MYALTKSIHTHAHTVLLILEWEDKSSMAVSNRWTGLWTGLLDWIAGSNQTASKNDDTCVAHGTASKAKV